MVQHINSKKGLEKDFAKKGVTLQIRSEGETKLPCDPEKMKLALKKLLNDACLRSPVKKVVTVEIKAPDGALGCRC